MHSEVLTPAQNDLLPFVNEFKKDFCLVGGTAMALQIGHRRSIDFELFTSSESLDLGKIKALHKAVDVPEKGILYEAFDQLHIAINDVKITFFCYPIQIKAELWFDSFCKMPDLLTLAAMKVFALGGRAKWKDYVDLFFLLKSHFQLSDISNKAEEIFGDSFSTKLPREQLTYFEDIDYSEEVDFVGFEVTKEEIKKFLIEAATEEF